MLVTQPSKSVGLEIITLHEQPKTLHYAIFLINMVIFIDKLISF